MDGFTERYWSDGGGWVCNFCRSITHEPEKHARNCVGTLQAKVSAQAEEIERLQKLCADRPLFTIEYDRTACSDRDIDEWIEAIDIEGEKATGR